LIDITPNLILNDIKKSKSGYSDRKKDSIVSYSRKYNLPVMMVNRVIKTESSYRHDVINKYSGCIGLGGINAILWSHLLFKVDNGDLGKYLLKTGKTNYARYFKRIGYNVEATCIILSNYYYTYNDWTNTLIKYGGYCGKWSNSSKKQWYLASILD
jgi:hypothetical protein